MLVYNEASAEAYTGQRNLEQLTPPTTPSMTVKFESCFFEENQYSYSAIATISGTATLTSAVFRDNGTSRLGSIGATSTSEIQIETSCFIKNTALLYGVVMIDATSNITQNVENFGDQNGSILGNCTTVFNDVSGSCAVNGDCQGSCLPFIADSCKSILDVDRPIGETPPPAVVPTKEPQLPPGTASTNGTDVNGTSPSGMQSVESPPKTISGGAIVVIVAVVMIILCVMWTCCRKLSREGSNSAGKAVTKGKGTPVFNEKSFKGKASKRKTKKYDEFDDYDRLESDDGDEDDQYCDESEQSTRKKKSKMKKDTLKNSLFRWGGEGTTKKTKRRTRTKEMTKEFLEIDADNGRNEEHDNSGSDSEKGRFEDEQELDKEMGTTRPSNATKGAKKVTKLRSSFSLSSSVHESFDTTKEKGVVGSAALSSKPFNPFD